MNNQQRIQYWANVQQGITNHQANVNAAKDSVQAVIMVAKAQVA